LTDAQIAGIVPANKSIRKGTDEDEYADAGTTENLPELRKRVKGTAEKDLGAAGRKGPESQSSVDRAGWPP
jgi:hypothetical protein